MGYPFVVKLPLRQALEDELALQANAAGGFSDVIELQKVLPKLKRPPLYQVILHNDDFSPMDFVVQVLQKIFFHNEEKAVQIMLQVHQTGKGICGVFTRDIAETKVALVNDCARSSGYPLLCTMEAVQ
jgi:ATP-dependent Clp protease adaptor protein ClpS